jgi:hypothetical protein
VNQQFLNGLKILKAGFTPFCALLNPAARRYSPQSAAPHIFGRQLACGASGGLVLIIDVSQFSDRRCPSPIKHAPLSSTNRGHPAALTIQDRRQVCPSDADPTKVKGVLGKGAVFALSHQRDTEQGPYLPNDPVFCPQSTARKTSDRQGSLAHPGIAPAPSESRTSNR